MQDCFEHGKRNVGDLLAVRERAEKRAILMTIIDTLSRRNEDVVATLVNVPNELARDPKRDGADLL